MVALWKLSLHGKNSAQLAVSNEKHTYLLTQAHHTFFGVACRQNEQIFELEASFMQLELTRTNLPACHARM